ncbi:34052_t:CDS:1, partial [Racocetra persica]
MFSVEDFKNTAIQYFQVNGKVLMISQNFGDKLNIEPKISDLGLSRQINESSINRGIYGVEPYIAPEVLSGKQHTRASDIYSLGVIMTEISTGKPPFNNFLSAINGVRPEFALGTPDCYVQLANQCMDGNPLKRPTAKEVYKKVQEWKIILNKETEELDQ